MMGSRGRVIEDDRTILTEPEALPAPTFRYHSLDALRATMMLLGIYLHAAVAYSRHGAWPWKDGSTTGAFDASLGLIHVFRMPVFYVIAGFFAALLLEQRGTAEFIRNRAVRILVPFAGAWVVLFPLVALLATTGAGLDEPEAIPGSYVAFFTSGEVLRHLDPMHLWFLEYLLIFYVIALAAMPLARRLPALVSGLDRVFRVLVISPFAPGIFALITFPILCLMEDGPLDDPSGFIPRGGILAAYLVFFAAGWFLYRNTDLLPVLCRLPRMPILLGLGLAAAVLGGYSIWHRWNWPADHGFLWFLASAWFASLSMWLFTLGLTGVVLRYLQRPIAWIRYLSDASYWLYLVHMPVLLAFQIAVSRTGWPPGLKIAVVLGASLPCLLASYHFLVRPTWVGALLNGRRRPMRRRRWASVVALWLAAVFLLVSAGATSALTITTTAPSGAAEEIPASLDRPEGAGPFPAIVILHDCSGLGPASSGAPGRWAKELVGRGYVVLIPDSFTTRGHAAGVCTVPVSQRRSDITPARRVRDAYAALAYVRTLPYVDRRRVGLIGGSHGGTTTLATMVAPEASAGFAAAVALNPSCAAGPRSWRPSASEVYAPLAPLLILAGDKDDWTPAEPCRKMAYAAQKAGQPVTIKIYPGAHHSFDSEKPERYVEARINMNSPTGRGATTGGHPEAWADSIREVAAFFGQHLK